MESLDWRKILTVPGAPLPLRATLHNVAQNKLMDAYYSTTYGGVLRQNDATSDAQKKWDLHGRTVVSAISTSTPYTNLWCLRNPVSDHRHYRHRVGLDFGDCFVLPAHPPRLHGKCVFRLRQRLPV